MNRTNTIELVDFLKGYSMFTIVLFHILKVLPLSELMSKIIFFGGSGVHTFILISGFGLYLSWMKRPLTYFEFLKKRLVRIYVPYIFIVTIVASISLFIPIYKSSWYTYLGHVFLYKMFDETIVGSLGDQFWFLSTIFQLYFIFPLLVKLKGRLSEKTFLGSGIVISIIWIILVLAIGKESQRTWNSFFLQYVWEFMLGMTLASMYLKQKPVLKLKTPTIGLVAIGGIFAFGFLAIYMGGFGRMVNDIPALVGYTFLAVYIYRLKINSINRFFVFTGTFSFSLYLVHILVLRIITYIFRSLEYDLNYFMVFITLVLCFLIAFWFNKGIQLFYKSSENPKGQTLKAA